jgi:hypothetical protein
MGNDTLTLHGFLKAIEAGCDGLSEAQLDLLKETFAPAFLFLEVNQDTPKLDVVYPYFMGEEEATGELARHLAFFMGADAVDLEFIAFPIGTTEYLIDCPDWEEEGAWRGLLFDAFSSTANPKVLGEREFSKLFLKVLESRKDKMCHPYLRDVLNRKLRVSPAQAWMDQHFAAWNKIAHNKRHLYISRVWKELEKRLYQIPLSGDPEGGARAKVYKSFSIIYGALVYWAVGLIVEGHLEEDLTKAICGILKVYHKHPILGVNIYKPNLWMVLTH